MLTIFDELHIELHIEGLLCRCRAPDRNKGDVDQVLGMPWWIQWRSLVGNALVQRPDLFGAVVCQVPLLDMRRYSKLLAGASWMAEYGDPDTDDWEYMQHFSPYHMVDADKTYPAVLFTTSTRDDRVHPAHARKMVYKMLDGKESRQGLFYYENIEGGHGGAADADQRARVTALIYDFMSKALSD